VDGLEHDERSVGAIPSIPAWWHPTRRLMLLRRRVTDHRMARAPI
jgi:hypothetical protein